MDARVVSSILLVLLGIALGCSERRPLYPEESFKLDLHDPFENREAEELALWLSEELQAPEDLYLRVRDDLAAIRTLWGDSLPIVHLRFFAPMIPGGINLVADPEAIQRMKEGRDPDFDSLNALYGASSVGFDWSVGVRFRYLLNPCRLFLPYATLQGVRRVFGDGIASYMHWYMYATQQDDSIYYIFQDGWGDCPAGCIDYRYRCFRTSQSGRVYLGEWVEEQGDSLPSWHYLIAKAKSEHYNCEDDAYRFVDRTPPARVTDLRVIGPQLGMDVEIRFTVPGDDGWDGYAESIIVLAALEPMTDANFANVAYRSWKCEPGKPGHDTVLVLAVDSKQASYLAVRVYDGSGNWSGISNSVSTRNVWLDGWTFFTAENSPLPGNSVTTLARDRMNRLWIGTTSGLAVYDHGQWAVYTHADSPLPDDRVTSLALTVEGVAWIGTRAGLARFDGLTWDTYTPANSQIPQPDIACLAVSPGGDVWTGYGMAGYGLHRFDGTSWRQVDPWPSPTQGFTILSLLQTGNGAMWAGAMQGLHRWEAGEWTFFDPAATVSNPLYVTRLFEDQSGGIWCATMTNQLLRRFATDVQVWQMPKGTVTSLTQTAAGRIWLVAGAVPHLQQGNKWKPIGMSLSGLPSNYCTVVQAEGADTLWIGTADKGLCRWDLKAAKLD